MAEEVDLLFREVKLGRVMVDGAFAAWEAPLPVGTELRLGGRLARVSRAVEQGGEGPPGMWLSWADEADDEAEIEVITDGAASASGEPADSGKSKKRKRRR